MKEASVNLLSGAFCGITVDSILYPLDTLKTRFQAKEGSVIVSKYKGLFKGLSTLLMGSVPAAAVYWTVYEKVKEKTRALTHNNQRVYPLCDMAAAGVGEMIGSSIRNPFEVTKQYIQIRGYSNPLKAIIAISKQRGIKALYSGYGTLLMRDIPFDMIEYSLYEAEKRCYSKMVKRHNLLLVENMLMGSIAGVVTATVTCPLDVIKTRIMLSADLPQYQRKGIIKTISGLLKEEGWQSLFRGVIPRSVGIALGGAIWFGAFEEYRRIILKCI